MMKPGSPRHICVDSAIEKFGINVLWELYKELENFTGLWLFRVLLTLKKPEDIRALIILIRLAVPWAIL